MKILLFFCASQKIVFCSKKRVSDRRSPGLPARKYVTASIYIKYITDISNSIQKSGCVLKNKQKSSRHTNKMHKKMSRSEYKLHIHTVDFKTLYVIISLVKKFM